MCSHLGTLPIELQGGPVDPSPLALADFIKRFSESKLPLHRIKIMIVGVENIGKTTVTRALTKAWNSDIETENLQISGACMTLFIGFVLTCEVIQCLRMVLILQTRSTPGTTQ